MKIKVGEYVRTKTGYIEKVGMIYKNNIYFESELEDTYATAYQESDIRKHSENIIDLVEVGDIVNGHRVDNIDDNVLVSNPKGIDKSGVFVPIAQYDKDITTILTHEHHYDYCYKTPHKRLGEEKKLWD